jgi:hypothetical protein
LVFAASAGAWRTPIAIENARPGSSGWSVAPDGSGALSAYASELSVAPGETLHLHVSVASSSRYRVEVYRLGWYGGRGGRLVACSPSCVYGRLGRAWPVPSFDPGTGRLDAGWPVTDTLKVGRGWPSGYYLADVVLVSAAGRTGVRVPFIVRASVPSAPILVQVPVNTWEAYNAWGGRSFYVPDQSGVSNSEISFLRPWDQVPFTLGSPQQWELPLLHFLERFGFNVNYQTDLDTDRNPGLLERYRLVIVAGHSEYWTHGMRDAFAAARGIGINLAFMGANIGYWQTRYTDASRTTLLEYRRARQDPEPDPSLKTTWFRRLSPPRPECQLLGVQFSDVAGEATIGGVHDYTPTNLSDPWFKGTGLTPTSSLPGLVGGEWDNIPANCPGATPPVITVLFSYSGAAPAQAVRYSPPSGARVFSTGSLTFNFGLDTNTFIPTYRRLESPALERFVRNAINDLAAH